jgi:hypothetical protein
MPNAHTHSGAVAGSVPHAVAHGVARAMSDAGAMSDADHFAYAEPYTDSIAVEFAQPGTFSERLHGTDADHGSRTDPGVHPITVVLDRARFRSPQPATSVKLHESLRKIADLGGPGSCQMARDDIALPRSAIL